MRFSAILTLLDRFLALVPRSGTVLDIGCGMAEPIGRYLLDAGVQVVGIDSSPSMIALCKARRPDAEWIAADMRHLELGRRFNGLLAWDSFTRRGHRVFLRGADVPRQPRSFRVRSAARGERL